MGKVKIEHELLSSKNATFVALLNELIKWGEANGVSNEAQYHFVKAHLVANTSPQNLKNKSQEDK